MELKSLLAEELKLTPYQKKALEKLGLKTAENLLWYFPFRYEKFAEPKTIADAPEGAEATFYGNISRIELEKTWRKKIPLARAILNDGTGKMNLVWFHQPFIANLLKENDYVAVTGKVQKGKNGCYVANPVYEKIVPEETEKKEHNMLAVYPETRGITSRWFRFSVQKIFKKISPEQFGDFLPGEILKRYNIPSLKNALVYIHTPKALKDAEAARKRFAFEEILLLQISRLSQKASLKTKPAPVIKTEIEDLKDFFSNLNFQPTKSQMTAIKEILNDFGKKEPSARLLEGDVGSGKTLVAAAASYAIFKNASQTAYMAPTEVLARQLFESFIKYFVGTNAKIGLITSSECRKFPSKSNPKDSTQISKTKLLEWTKNGEIPLLIGTHALIQKNVQFKKLGFVVIDEQHRFGTNQRAMLVSKKNTGEDKATPHFLSMTATPIPRTLALTIYGDLDLTLIDEMPPGRKEIITEIISPKDRALAYEKTREEIKNGRQAYIICPRIEPRDENKENFLTMNMKAVKEETERLKKDIFPEFEIGMLHGKMTPKEKEKTMKKFRNNEIQILVATSVIEVGVDVPNATVLIIEGAERFGLSQLHQLRGRVRRSTHQPYCFVFTESNSAKTASRLKALKTAKNGFELAEYDLEFRGAGDLAGKKQWGVTDVGMEALKNIKMVEAARKEAQDIIEKSPELKNFPLLRQKILERGYDIHFE